MRVGLLQGAAVLAMIIGMTGCGSGDGNDSDPIAGFWATFKDNEGQLRTADSADVPAYDVILERLKRIHEDLWFEFGVNEGGAELIVTAEGNRELFPIAEKVVSLAPSVPGWTFLALRPKVGFPESVSWEDLTVNLADVAFRPQDREDSARLDLTLYVSGLDRKRSVEVHNALLQALDHGLGERAFAEQIAGTSVAPLPEGKTLEDYRPLTQLATFLEERSKQERSD